MKPHIAKAVLIGIDLDDPYNTSKSVIRVYEGSHCVEEANYYMSLFRKDKQERREFAVVANEAAWYLWNDQQPHLK